ncbi:methionyl-tRNA formyltransferase [Butyrivibrio sp. NC3005]|uniref:methionyl-tRNA formyltransferase n=1 Tax=Butyrivibrio sp. NC3005 TaxID=1280685 RepID=UPI00040B383E|nr:methionyl-tRNA formyltransferase [Butyrivibrio sp. NC3005]
MKIVYMGTPDFAVGALDALVKAGHEIVCVVTQPDKAKGRSKELTFSPVKEYAVEHNITVYQPVKIKETESVEYLKTFNADIFVVAAFGQILSKEVLDIPKFGCVNIHASLLPLYRGASPIQQSILDGQKETGVTLMQMDVGMDTGDILMQEAIPITNEDTAGTLFDKLQELGADMIVRALPLIEKGQLTRIPQDESKATKVGKLTKEMGCIDWNKDADYVDRLIRTTNPWPSAYTTMNGKTLKIWKAIPLESTDEVLENGTVFNITKNDFMVKTGKGALKVIEVQLSGKKRMSAGDFLRGNHLQNGDRFI